MKRQAAAKSIVEEKEPSPPPPTGVTKTRKTPKKKKKKDPNEPQKYETCYSRLFILLICLVLIMFEIFYGRESM